MSLNFRKVIDEAQMKILADVAKEIWNEYYPGIITVEQVNYMVEKYQAADAITKQITDEGYQYFMMLCGEEVMGYLGVKTDGDKLFLSKLYLKKKFRGKGYFSKMLLFAEHHAKKERLESLYLTVNKHNDSSIAVYQKKGFAITKEQKTDIGNGFVMDDYVMEKTLPLEQEQNA